MKIAEYTVEEEASWPLLKELAQNHPKKADRLVDALESFVTSDTETSDRVYPPAGAVIEVFVVPPRVQLAEQPDASLLVRVDHKEQRIRVVACFEDYDLAHPAEQRLEYERLARRAVEGV